MFSAVLSTTHPYSISIFGAQYHGTAPEPSKVDLIDRFEALITKSASYTETLEQNGPSPHEGLSKVWMGYWKSVSDYKQWWEGKDVADFWASLPDDAGFWREILTLPASRTQSATNRQTPSGLAHLGKQVPNTTKTGYWGCYRDRIEDATVAERLNSSISSVPSPKSSPGKIRMGRVKMSQFPDNMCFVVEGQDHSPMGDAERQYWFESFDKLATTWIMDVVTAGTEGGMVSGRLCYAPESGQLDKSGTGEEKSALAFNRKVQILYFLDLKHMERIGKTNRGHVNLRSRFLESYCPTGPMSNGDISLWVDMGIVKSQELEAEYIGCYEGTGFLAYDHHPDFKSDGPQQNPSSWFNALGTKLFGS